MPAGIIGGAQVRVFTPTEAGVAACVYAFVVAPSVYRELPLRQLYPLLWWLRAAPRQWYS